LRFAVHSPAGRLLLQPSHRHPPPAGQDCPVEPSLLPHTTALIVHRAPRRTGHPPNREVFHPDHIKPARQTRGGLLHPILTPIRDTHGQARDRAPDPAAPVRSPLTAAQRAAQATQPVQLPGRQRRRHHHTPIHPHHPVVTRRRDRIRGKRQMPPARPIPRHPIGLHSVRHCTRPAKPDPPDLRHPHQPPPAIEPLNVPWFHRDLPESLIQTGLAPSGPAVRTTKKVPHRLAEIPQRLLLHRHRPSTRPRELRPSLGQLPRLLHTPNVDSQYRQPRTRHARTNGIGFLLTPESRGLRRLESR
jgi:hypothetical protein